MCLLAMARMEGHLIYYAALLLGLYPPLRLLLHDRDDESSGGGAAPALWLVLAGLALLAPPLLRLKRLPTLPALPLYQAIYKLVSYFNFPRVPGQLVIFAVLMWALLAGWALRELTSPWRTAGRGRSLILGGALAVALLASIWPTTPAGVCLLPPVGPHRRGHPPRAARRSRGPSPPAGLGHLACGQSPVLQLRPDHSQHRRGYSQRLLAGGATGLHRADLHAALSPGLRPGGRSLALAMLERLKAPLVLFHDDAQVYPRKISPLPPALARQRLLASDAFSPDSQAGTSFLLRRLPGGVADLQPGISALAPSKPSRHSIRLSSACAAARGRCPATSR